LDQIICKIIFQTTQRRTMLASCGAEIELNAASHPSGTFSRDAGCAGDTGKAGDPSSCCHTATDGSRSPLSKRFTDGAGPDVKMPVLGKEGNEMKLAVNSASITPATRTKNTLRIGSSPQLSHDPQHPKIRSHAATPDQERASGNCSSGAVSRLVMTMLTPA
jgi:hypothetical protein